MIQKALLALGLLALVAFIPRIIKKIKKIKSIDVFELKKQLDNSNNTLIVDVRSAEEYAKGHIPGAINISLPELSNRINELHNHGESHQLALMCRTSNRSAKAYELLTAKQINSVVVSGGMNAWMKEGFSVEK